MTAFNSTDHEFMAQALRLARLGTYSAHPNPRVGCILVQSGKCVGQGWHRKTGAAHAEVVALQEAGSAAAGATAYVTLEPCSHVGKTPPCANALIAAGVARVIVAIEDPNPKVAGAGIAVLREAGIEVEVGLLAEQATMLNRGFVSRFVRGRPFVRLKIAMSLDGCTAMASGESRWITGTVARGDVQKLRASSGAIITGIDTVIADDPALTVRDAALDNLGVQPLRVVIDSALRMPPSAAMLSQSGETEIFCIADENRVPLEDHGAIVTVVRAVGGRPELAHVLDELAQRGVNDALIEAGPTLAGSFLDAGLVDELVIYQAPHIMGSETRGMVATPGWQTLEQRLDLNITDCRKVGNDMRITARPVT